jgi:transcriptional regulator with XRE-family HTH domain
METTADRLRDRIRVLNALPSPEQRAALRKNLGLSRRDLAEAVGVSEAAIGHWERGIRHPRGEYLRRYVDVLDVLKREAA